MMKKSKYLALFLGLFLAACSSSSTPTPLETAGDDEGGNEVGNEVAPGPGDVAPSPIPDPDPTPVVPVENDDLFFPLDDIHVPEGIIIPGVSTDSGQVLSQPAISSFTVNRNCVVSGSPITLTWETSFANDVTLNGEAVAPDGSQRINLSENKVFTLRATNAAGSVRREVRAQVQSEVVEISSALLHVPGLGIPDQLSSSNHGAMVALSGGRLYKGNLVQGFSPFNPNPNVADWTAVAIHPENPNVILAGTHGVLYYTVNGGRNWSTQGFVLLGVPLDVLNIHPFGAGVGQALIALPGRTYSLDLASQEVTQVTFPRGVVPTFTHFADDGAENLALVDDDSLYTATFEDGEVSTTLMPFPNAGEIYNVAIKEGKVYVAGERGLFVTPVSNPAWVRYLDVKAPVYSLLFREEEGAAMLYAATSEGLVKSALPVAGRGWENEVDDIFTFLFEEEGVVGVAGDDFFRIEENLVPSGVCQ